MTHPPTRRSRDTGDEADNGLVLRVELLQEISGILLGGSSNFANHDDTISLLVLEEDLQTVDEVGAGEGITTDSNNEGLSEASLCGLVNGFVSEGSRARYDTNAAALVDEARHDSDFALTLGLVRSKKI